MPGYYMARGQCRCSAESCFIRSLRSEAYDSLRMSGRMGRLQWKTSMRQRTRPSDNKDAKKCGGAKTRRRQVKAESAETSQSVGYIRRLVLDDAGRQKSDETSDRDFYSFPRIVHHADDGFRSKLTEIYRERIYPGAEVLDVGSSWVSHLPEDVEYKKVIGHGLNASELSKNRSLSSFFVRDLNKDPEFRFENSKFDAIIMAMTIQYMQYPEKVLSSLCKVLRPGGVIIISFTKWYFPSKAIQAWTRPSITMQDRANLVASYLQAVSGFTKPIIIGPKKPMTLADKINAVIKAITSPSDPFFAVVAYRAEESEA